MIKREKNGKLRGSVLLTVVCVMSLLIVFLVGTLALATAANNRAHVNYSTAQTDVTSRTVVDAAIKGMVASPDYAKVVNKIGTTGGVNSVDVKVQLDKNTVPDVGKYGDISRVHIELAGKKKFYDADKKEWIDGDILKFTSTVSMAGVDSTTSAYIVKQPPTDGDGGGGGGAGFVTTSGADLTCSSNLYGGTYINLPELGEDINGNKNIDSGDKNGAVFYDYSYRTDDDYANRWYKTNGDGTNNSNYDPKLYRQFAPYNSGDSSTYFWLGKDGGADAEADLYINNNMYIQEWKRIVFSGEGSGITVWGDLIFHNANADKMRYVFNNMPATEIAFNKMPYIYVDGTIKSIDPTTGNDGSKIMLGNPVGTANKYPINIFCGDIQAGSSVTDLIVDGNLFCMNEKEKSYITPTQTTNLYSWSGSVINKTESTKNKHKGSIYAKGDLELANVTVMGDVRVEGTCTIGPNVMIYGDLVAKVLLEGNEAPNVVGNIYCGNLAEVLQNKDVLVGFKKLPTIKHPKQEGVVYDDIKVVIENDKRNYYFVKATYDNELQKNVYEGHPYDEIDWGNGLCYEWLDDFDPKTVDFDVNDASFDQVQPYLKLDSKRRKNENPQAIPGVDGSLDYYYVKTDFVGYDEYGNVLTSSRSERVEGKEYGIKNDDSITYDVRRDIEEYYTIPNIDGSDSGVEIDKDIHYVYYKNPTAEKPEGELVEESVATAAMDKLKSQVKNITDYSGDIYPKYAERFVILGIDEVPGHDKTETQIVKTMDEVLENVANPYKEGTLSVELSKQHDELIAALSDASKKSKIYFESHEDILNAYNVYADNVQADGTYDKKTPVLIGDPNNDTFGNGNAMPNAGVLITDDCILNMELTSKAGYLVFEPGTKDILVIINKLKIGNDPKIIVNDSQGGTVNFFIESGNGSAGTMELAANGWLAPTKYLKAFVENKNDGNADNNVLIYNTTGVAGLALDKLGKPNINIYGASGTKLSSTESKGFIANVISPDLEFIISAGGKMDSMSHIEDLYYNGNKAATGVGNPYLIGCLNTSFANAPNNFNVVFVTDSSSKKPDKVGDGEDAFNYRILYYDEY